MKNKSLLIIVFIVAVLLLIPLVTMQFTVEVNWNVFDFLVAAVLLLSTGLGINFILKKVKGTTYRIVLSVAVLIILFLIWVELAVGIFDSPLSGN